MPEQRVAGRRAPAGAPARSHARLLARARLARTCTTNGRTRRARFVHQPCAVESMIEQRLTRLLAGSATLEIATSAGRPWVAAAFFAEDGPYVLQVMLEARGRTLAYLRE